MGRLTEIILNSVPIPGPRGYNNLTCSGLFPCPYKMYLSYTNQDYSEITPTQMINMEDGHDQEEQAMHRLFRAGILVEDRQQEVVVGRAKTTGHIDGTVTLDKKYLWEHKAMRTDIFQEFKKSRYQTMPGYYAQVQVYMEGMGLKSSIVQVKCKENNEIDDAQIDFDPDYTNKLLAWVDSIKLDGWVPEPSTNPYCLHCYTNCFGRRLNFGGMDTTTNEEMAQKWRDGKRYQAIGSAMEEEARYYYIGVKDKNGDWIRRGVIGEKDQLLADGLKIVKQVSHRTDLSKQKCIEEFGVDNFYKVTEEKEIISYVIRDTVK